ncbi:hypothetical protein Jiend_19980 [Micromonospora endophytica]|nr:hypothetical protein Jiend_19980 [Micromonospora endophytica]
MTLGNRGTLSRVPPLNLGNPQPKIPLNADLAWRTTADRAAETILFFDFDGTLAPVADDPTQVQPAPKVLAALEALAPVVRRIAIVSARPVEFLREHFGGLTGVDLYGLYGLEHSHSGGDTVTEPAALPWVPTMAELADQARAELPPGALVEYKRLSVALHWRTAPQLAAAVEKWGHAQAERLGLRVQVGRMVLEVKPPVDRDKGMVIGELVQGWAEPGISVTTSPTSRRSPRCGPGPPPIRSSWVSASPSPTRRPDMRSPRRPTSPSTHRRRSATSSPPPCTT